jgi:hypothetical protein
MDGRTNEEQKDIAKRVLNNVSKDFEDLLKAALKGLYKCLKYESVVLTVLKASGDNGTAKPEVPCYFRYKSSITEMKTGKHVVIHYY